jgi:DNA polymerase III epsilon subunit-like protein
MTITLELPGRDAGGRLSWISREVRLVRDADGWRSADPILAVSIRGPFAATIYHRALRLGTAPDGSPLAPRRARPITEQGRRAAVVLGARVPAELEIVTRIGEREARAFGWASEWPSDADPSRNDTPAGACIECGSIGATLDDPDGPRCPRCAAERAQVHPVVLRALRLWASDAQLLFYDTETDGLVRLDERRAILGRAPRVWDLAQLVRRANARVVGPERRGNGSIITGERLPLRISKLTGADPELPLRGREGRSVWGSFALAAKGKTMIAHNGALFDEPIVRAEAARFGIAIDPAGWFDTLPLARVLLPQVESHALCRLAETLLVPSSGGLHRAIADTRLLSGVWDRLIDRAIWSVGGKERAKTLAFADRPREERELYGWLENSCTDCGAKSVAHKVFPRCDACREAAKPHAATCVICGETDRLDFEPKGDFTCRICRTTAAA